MTLSPGAKGFQHISIGPLLLPPLAAALRRSTSAAARPVRSHHSATPSRNPSASTPLCTSRPPPQRRPLSPAHRRRPVPCAPPTPSEPAHRFALRLDVVRDHVRALVRPCHPVSTSPRRGSHIRHGRDLELARPSRASASSPSSPGVSSSVGALVAWLRTNRAVPVTSSRNAVMPPPRTCRRAAAHGQASPEP